MKGFLISLLALLSLLPLACTAPTGDDGLDPGHAYLTITNGLTWYNIVKIIGCRSIDGEPDWGFGRFWEGELAPGESVKIVLPIDSYNIYDIRCENENGATYTRYDVEIPEDGYTWEVTQEDRDD
ncbi:MAG: hypothetical protein NTW26_05240 [bacterium]|nr:hypothetical protein [bacterium]